MCHGSWGWELFQLWRRREGDSLKLSQEPLPMSLEPWSLSLSLEYDGAEGV